MKTSIPDDFRGGIDRLVDNNNRELEDRKRRDLKIKMYNLEEHDHDNGIDSKEEDENDVRQISRRLLIENIEIVTRYRLRRKQD